MRGWIRLLLLGATLGAGTSRAAADPRHFEDATLRAVQFIDDKEGWAAGDEGTIWHTLDGGRRWIRQPTGVRASLRSVCFLSADVGWVAGREELPAGGSAGVLLFTRDGGLKWQRLLAGALPGLNQVRFADAANGYLLGDGTDHMPSGLFRTTDGGRTWEPVPGPRTTSWFAGDFSAKTQGIMTGAWARLGIMEAGSKAKAEMTLVDAASSTDSRDILGLHVLPQRVLAVAQGGMVLTSASAGAKWGFADLKLPNDVLTCLDFHAVHGAGRKIWVVGRPGSAVLHSDDSGETWRLQKTGCALPLHGVHFFSDQRGWAVGELGTILGTTDGGGTWQVQRQGGQRAAILFVQARGQDLPIDSLARLGASEGYLTHALRVVAPDPASAAPHRAVERLRYAAAARLAGAASGETLWSFSLPQHLGAASRDQVVEYWNRRHAQQAPQELLRQLVLAIRTWRPNVVIGDHPQAKNAASALVAEAVQEAVRQANDSKAFPEQIEQLGLAPWQAGRVYAVSDSVTATSIHDNEEILDALQSTPRDHAAWAAAVLPDAPALLPRERGFRLMQTQVKGGDGSLDLMAGLTAKIGEARRDVKTTVLDADLAKALREKKALLILAETLDDPSVLQARLLPLLAKLPEEHASLTVSAIAAQYLSRGRWDLAHEAYALQVSSYPAHPLSVAAYRWLIRHDSSSEMRRRYELKGGAVQKLDFKPGSAVVQANGKPDGGQVKQIALHDQPTTRAALQNSLALGKRLGGFGSMVATDPSMLFCLQSARRGLGDTGKATDWYGKFKGYVAQGPWHAAANAEVWLANPNSQPPRKLARCRLTDVRPYLDGDLDDACWQGVKPLLLDNAVGDTAMDYTTQALFAYDQEFFYIALKCRHPKGKQVAPVKVRPRDADVEPYDRVSILLDLDRDYTTCFHLQIDQRGCVREDCCGDLSWNPRWFVAIKSTEDCWQIEAAIPLGELTGQRIPLNSAWAFNVVRIVPGQGVQSWSQPADVEPRPEGMSLLQFQQDAARAPAQPMSKAP